MWAHAQLGSFSTSGKTFIPGPSTPQSVEWDWGATEVRHITRTIGEPPVAVYVSHGQICTITCSSPLRIRNAATSGQPPVALTDFQDFIALPRDSAGRSNVPKSRVTALVEAP